MDWPLGCDQLGEVVVCYDLRLNGVANDWILSLIPSDTHDFSIMTVCPNL